jgi:hypothetical protein
MEEYKGVYQDLLSHIQQAVQIASSKHAKILSASHAAHDESVRSLKVRAYELNREHSKLLLMFWSLILLF